MRQVMVCVATLVAAISGGCAMQTAPVEAPQLQVERLTPVGVWHGAITRAGIGEIRLELRIEEASSAFSGVLANMDQGGVSTPLADIAFDGSALTFSVPATRAGFAGKWDATEGAWAGEYTHPAGKSAAMFRRGPAPELPPLPAVTGLDGRWEGVLQGALPVVLRIETSAAGTRAWMDAPGPQPAAMPIRMLTREGTHVTFGLPAMAVNFDGQLSASGDKLEGTMTQAGRPVPLALARTSQVAGTAAGVSHSQIPQRPYPYREVIATIANPAAPGVALGCTLTAPNDGDPHPAVVLIGGSGAEDRDLTGAGHKTFLVLADHLTRKGIAVLRCDDRDYSKPVDAMKASLLRDFVSDVRAELAWLRARPEIDAARVGVLGGSLGGVIGPMVAAGDSDVAFVVMLAGLGVPAVDAMVEQRAMTAASVGASEAEVAAIRASWPGVHRQIRDAADEAAAQAIVRAALAATPKARPPVYPTEDIAVGMMSSQFARDLYLYDPAPVIAGISVPVLSIIGTLDVQVSARQNSDGLRQLLSRHPDATIVELPGANHLFQRAKTGAIAEYALIEESFAPEALELISDWLARRAGL